MTFLKRDSILRLFNLRTTGPLIYFDFRSYFFLMERAVLALKVTAVPEGFSS